MQRCKSKLTLLWLNFFCSWAISTCRHSTLKKHSLLRVSQEQEFERLGGSRTIRGNVRIVAATNVNLVEMVEERRFRADLLYRLHVFPIALPPLRERSVDIPELVWHFVPTFAGRMNKVINVISDEVMEIIRTHNWPGNVRELQNFVEPAVITSPGPVLRPAGRGFLAIHASEAD